MPHVSVIMNVRNGAVTLRASIDSVLAQTYQDWELVFWDDCSTDASASIAASYSDPRIRYLLSPEDTPLGRARDLAIRQARGEWIAFIDQDDLWVPNKLELQLAAAGSDPAVGMVYGRTVSFFPDGSERDYDHRHEYMPLPDGDIFRELFEDSCFICVSSTMMRRAAVAALGGIPAEFQVSPDYFLYLALARGHRVRAVQQVVCRYRIHSGNMTHHTGRRIQAEVLRLLDRWEQELDPQLLAARRRVHSTVLAWHELRRGETRVAGLQRLWSSGGLAYFAARPFARACRAVRRRLQRPFWQSEGGGYRREEPAKVAAPPG